MRERIKECPICQNDLFLFDGEDYFCPECEYTFEDAIVVGDSLYSSEDDEE